jgi:transposase-like protein
MPAKKTLTGTDKDLNLASLSKLFTDEDAARQFVESKLWPNGPVCPHCGSCEAYRITARPESKKPARPGLCTCKDCRKQFTVRIGTIFEDSHIPFSKWLMAMHLMTSSKKGISSLQISREVGVTIKSAWFMTHRIREAMRDNGGDPLTGIVEADETYVGGKPRKGSGERTKPGRPGKDNPRKTCVAVLVERDGRARAHPIEQVTIDNLRVFIEGNVNKGATLHTDEFAAYKPIGREMAGHECVSHLDGEYSRDGDSGPVHCNTAESFFALLKRGHYGIFHRLSKHHLHRYADEFSFRWNNRKASDGERMIEAIKGADGKRLTYHQAGYRAGA